MRTWDVQEGTLMWTGLGCTEHPGVVTFRFPQLLWRVYCRYTDIPQCFPWIIRCVFCFQLEGPSGGRYLLLSAWQQQIWWMWFTKRGKNGVSAWRWLTDTVNLTQSLKINNELWCRCSIILSLSAKAFQLVNSALPFTCAVEIRTYGYAQWKQLGITVRWMQIKTIREIWPTQMRLWHQCPPTRLQAPPSLNA